MVDTKSQKVGTIEDYIAWFFTLFVSFVCFSTLIIQRLFNCVFYTLNYTHQFPIFWDFLSHFPKLSLLFSKFFSDAFCSIFLLKMLFCLISSLTSECSDSVSLNSRDSDAFLSYFCGYFPHRFFPLYIPSVRTGSPFLWSWSVERINEIALVIGVTFLRGLLLPWLSRSISDAVCRMFFFRNVHVPYILIGVWVLWVCVNNFEDFDAFNSCVCFFTTGFSVTFLSCCAL